MTDSESIRLSAVAGRFYPDHEGRLAAMVDQFLDEAPSPAPQSRAIVSPHAGYAYSGAAAGAAWGAAARSKRYRRVILLGPPHRVGVAGLALSSAVRFACPLGDVSVDVEIVSALLRDPIVSINDAAHRFEHSLETQLPFLVRALGSHVSVVPILVGETSPAQVGELLDPWLDEDTLLAVSSDLSHFLPDPLARRRDQATIDRIVALETGLTGDECCGYRSLNALSWVAREKGWSAHALDYRNSGDQTGDKDSVVGYAAMAYH